MGNSSIEVVRVSQVFRKPPIMPSNSSQPLLSSSSSSNPNIYEPPSTSPSRDPHPKLAAYKRVHRICRLRVKAFLSSTAQHYTVLLLVAFDLLGIFADIIINLYQCDVGDTDPKWDEVRNGLGIAGLVFSCLFMLELLLSVWAFGWRCVVVVFLPFLHIHPNRAARASRQYFSFSLQSRILHVHIFTTNE